MAKIDPYTGLPVTGKRKKNHVGPIILAVVLVAALGFGAGVTLREFSGVRIVKKDGAQDAPSGRIFSRAGDGADSGRTLGAPDAAPGTGAALLPAGTSGRSAAEIYASLAPSCVGITTETTTTNVFGQVTSGAITGSGFLLSSDGYILTNNHVIETAAQKGLEVKVMLYSGEEYTAQIIGGDAKSDVALLKIDGENLPAVVIGDFGSVQVGETVYAVGNPLGELTYSMTSGIVSALERSITISTNDAITMFQIDAAINNGNSGGPVCNDRGEIIGIASAKYGATGVEGLGFAIPIDDALKVADDLLAYGYVRGRAQLGIMVANAEAYNYEPGAIVVTVNERSCAENAGLAEGDIIVEAEGKTVTGTADLLDAKKDWMPGDSITLTIHRGEETMTLTLVLDEEKPE